jgi:hypothetical protein
MNGLKMMTTSVEFTFGLNDVASAIAIMKDERLHYTRPTVFAKVRDLFEEYGCGACYHAEGLDVDSCLPDAKELFPELA